MRARVKGMVMMRVSIVVVTLTPRFAPLDYADVMINFRVLSGGNKHICELQVVHSSMLNARKGLPGHLYYGIVRNAMELCTTWSSQMCLLPPERTRKLIIASM